MAIEIEDTRHCRQKIIGMESYELEKKIYLYFRSLWVKKIAKIDVREKQGKLPFQTLWVM